MCMCGEGGVYATVAHMWWSEDRFVGVISVMLVLEIVLRLSGLGARAFIC